MKAKGLVKVITALLLLICLYQISFTWVADSVEKDAEEYAQSVASKEDIPAESTDRAAYLDSVSTLVQERKRKYLDSISNEIVYNLGLVEFTYLEVKQQELSLGLDLQGGMSVVLQISIEDVLRSLSNDSKDPGFRRALQMTKEEMKDSQEDFLTVFERNYQQTNPNGKLATIFATRQNADRIKLNSSNDEVMAFLRNETQDAISRTYNIIRTRIDKFGVKQPDVTLQASTGRIVVELPGVDNPDRVRNLLQASAQLEFWETFENSEVAPALEELNKKLADELALTDTTGDTTATAPSLSPAGQDEAPVLNPADEDTAADTETDTIGRLTLGDDTAGADTSLAPDKAAAEFARTSPLFTIFSRSVYQGEQGLMYAPGPVVGYVMGKDTSRMNSYLKMAREEGILPADVKFLWSAKPLSTETEQAQRFQESLLSYFGEVQQRDYSAGYPIYELFAIKKQRRGNEPAISGDVVTDARQDFSQTGEIEVTLVMNTEGARKWARLTKEAAAATPNRSIAIVLDDEVYSAPRVNQEITGGRSSISGNFTIEEAKDLATILKAGKLPVRADIAEEEIVGPSLGKESINAGLTSLVAGLALVLLFMIFYYSGAGIIADVALLLNLFFIIGILASLGATLTLPGIAGIVLTIGMSVDANVLIFERIKEELARGKGLRLAIIDGYRNSYSSILDANITTLLTGIILAYFGSGPILGFATVLIIGILSSLFTAILVTRLIIDYMINKDKKIAVTNKATSTAFQNINIDFIGKRKIAYVVSGLLIAAGIASFATKGFNMGVEFEGGRTFIVRFDQAINTAEVRSSLQESFEEAPVVKTFGGNNQVKITTAYLVDESEPEADSIVEAKLYEGLAGLYKAEPTQSEFMNNYKMSSQKVQPTIADDIKTGAIWATIFSIAAIFLYLLIRFRRWQFGLGAVAAVAHDVLIVLALFSIFSDILPFSLEINQAFIAAILTVIGYSINDTVVVFDRIREYLGIHRTKPMKEVINMAVNTTLSRTMITSLTTFIVITILFIFGGEVIRGFSFALLVGILTGTYSSIFIATPVVVDFYKEKS